MRRARDGDLEAYEVLVARHSAVAHRTAVLLGAGADAEDVMQVAFINAFRALDRFRDDATFRPWLLRIVANETHNLNRSRRRRADAVLRATALAPVVGGGGESDESALAAERRSALLDAVRALPEKDRLVITYRYLLDLSEAETAQALGWPRGSVKSRLSRALRRLQAPVAASLGGGGDG